MDHETLVHASWSSSSSGAHGRRQDGAGRGCSQQPLGPRDDGLAVARYEPVGSGGFDALLDGVAEGMGGCLVVRQDHDARTTYVPVFATNDASAVRVAEGVHVALRGGEVARTDGWTVPDDCPSAGPFWLVAQPSR